MTNWAANGCWRRGSGSMIGLGWENNWGLIKIMRAMTNKQTNRKQQLWRGLPLEGKRRLPTKKAQKDEEEWYLWLFLWGAYKFLWLFNGSALSLWPSLFTVVATWWSNKDGSRSLPMSVTARAQIPFIYVFVTLFPFIFFHFEGVVAVRTADWGSRAACLRAHRLRPCWQQILKIMIYEPGSFGYENP